MKISIIIDENKWQQYLGARHVLQFGDDQSEPPAIYPKVFLVKIHFIFF
jgi:hypothetical protein